MVPWELAKVLSVFQLLLRGVTGVAVSLLDSGSPAAPGRDAWEEDGEGGSRVLGLVPTGQITWEPSLGQWMWVK